ncbi:MAG: ankyrin repeat domain-containing protein [Actinomycetia bacterium]|nr:ankyrin repeat domain-containing protein [Actinomycetes bacterium]
MSKKIIIIFVTLIIFFIILPSCGKDLPKDEINIDSLIEAIKLNNMEKVERLIKLGIDVNSDLGDGLTPLMMASANGQNDIVQILLENGADANAKGKEGVTALMLAAIYNRTCVADTLINNGADVNAVRDNGSTALMASLAIFKSTYFVELLLSNGADINIKDDMGKTAIDIASDRGNSDILNILKAVKEGSYSQNKEEKAIVCINYPPEVKRNSDNRWEWEIIFEETGGKIGYALNGEGYIMDAEGEKWVTEGKTQINRGKVTIAPGSKASDSYWLKSDNLTDGNAYFYWTGEDERGNLIEIYELVHLRP